MKVSKFKRYTYFLTGSEEVQIGLVTFNFLHQRLLNISNPDLLSEEELHERSFSFGSRFGEWLDKEWVEEVEPAAAKQTDFQVLEERFLSKLEEETDYLAWQSLEIIFVLFF